MNDQLDILALARLLLWGIGIVTARFTVVGGIAFWGTSTGGAKAFTLFLQRGDALRIITVGGIVIAVTFLVLARIIDETAVVAILSGIAGYVLGSLERGKNVQDSDHG